MLHFQHFSWNGTFLPNQSYAILKQDTIETIRFDGSFQAHLDTVHLLTTKSNLRLDTKTSPISNVITNETQANNTTSFISLNKRGPIKGFGSTVKPFSYLYEIIQLVLVFHLFNAKCC